MKQVLFITLFTGATLFGTSAAAQESCPVNYADGVLPVITNPALAKDTTHLCYRGFAVMFSGVSRTALWSAQYLTPEQVRQARGDDRVNSFHAEKRLPASHRSELRDYKGSCRDRGHLVPSGDAPEPESQNDTFSMANMVPQDPEHNQIWWAGVEIATRAMVEQQGPMHIVTGPNFAGNTVNRINGRVMEPTYLYKAIYDKKRGRAAAYLSENSPRRDLQVISIAMLERRIGINLYPTMPESIKNRPMDLPEPILIRKTANKPTAACAAQRSNAIQAADAAASAGPVDYWQAAQQAAQQATQKAKEAAASIDYQNAAKKTLQYLFKN